MYIYHWKFQVKADCIRQFETLYGQDGAWVALFKKSEAYIKTELLRSTLHDNEYTTSDYWQSKADYDLFYQEHRAEFAALDKLGEALTLKEEFLSVLIDICSLFAHYMQIIIPLSFHGFSYSRQFTIF